ncbi:MAG: hypothetical protein ACREOO_17205 [bacterium]
MNPKIRHSSLLLLLGALPLQVNLAPPDSSKTAVQLYGGLGQYALVNRGCEGQVLSKHAIPFQELSAGVEHRMASPLRLGIRSSYIFDKEEVFTGGSYYDPLREAYFSQTELVARENLTFNPYFNLEWKPIGIGGGYFWSRSPLTGGENFEDVDSPISAYLRLGSRRSIYFSSSFLHHIPVYTGGSYQIGLGSGKNPNFNWWLGWGFVGPYDGPGIALFKSDIRLQRHFTLNALGRVGFTEGISESAIGIGLTYR